MYWPVHQNNQAGYPFFQSNNFLANNVYQTSNVLGGPGDYVSVECVSRANANSNQV